MKVHCIAALLLSGLFSVVIEAAPRFSRGTSVAGAIAYQDAEDPTQFWYIPTHVPVSLGGSLQDFGVKYWGVERPFQVKQSDGFWRSIIGATLSGRAQIDINETQRNALLAEIKKAYEIANPKLLPIAIKDTKVTPVLGSSTLGLGNGSDVQFPKDIAVPSSFSFLVGSGDNRLFAQYVGAQANRQGVIADPSFAINVTGIAEFVGDPWVSKCKADLSQVWNKTRTQVNVSIGWGWFRLGSAQYSSIVQDLMRTGVISCDWKEGSLDTEKFGRQIMELGKEVFQALNAKASSGEGFFKFEPNPEPPDISGGGGGWWPWTVSVNGGYSSAHFNQQIKWEQSISYTGRFWWPVPMSMVLAVKCNSSTAHMFTELGSSVACITQDKADTLNTRVNREAAAKNKRLIDLLDRYLGGDITEAQYNAALTLLGKITLTEDMVATPSKLLKDKESMQTGLPDDVVDGLLRKAMNYTKANKRISQLKPTN